MLKFLIPAYILLFTLLLVLGTSGYTTPTIPLIACHIEILGSTNEAMLVYVRKSVALAMESDCKVLEVEVFSSGGPASTSVEISQTLRRVRSQGLLVVTVGRSHVASGATVVLSAGSPGHRFITENALVLVHGIQVSSGPFGSSMNCVDRKQKSVSEDDQLLNQAILQVATEYTVNTSKSLQETLSWLRCDNSQVGNGSLAVKLGLADKVID